MTSIAKPPVVAGAMAAVRWVDGRFYLVRVLQVSAGGSRVQFDDGGTETVAPASVVPVPERAAFRVGEEVMAVWKGDRMYPGTIQSVTPQGYVVAWHDGDAPLVVPPGRLTYLAWAAAVAPKAERPWQDVTAAVLGPPAGGGPRGGGPPPLPRPVPPPLPGRPTPAAAGASAAAGRVTITIFIPGPVMPVDRGIRFVEPLQEALSRRGLGEVFDEGTELVGGPAGRSIRGCWIRVATADVTGATAVIRSTLERAGAPPGTTVTPDGR